MEEYIEVSAKTKEEAIMNAAIQLGTSSCLLYTSDAADE